MILAENQEAGFNLIFERLGDLSADIDAAFNVANNTVLTLQTEIDALETLRDQLQQENIADEATITQLNDTIAALTAAEAAEDAEVVTKLDAVATALEAMDTTVESNIPEPAPTE